MKNLHTEIDMDMLINKFVRVCGQENISIIHENSLHTRVTVWCALWSSGIIGPYFSEKAIKKAGTLKGIHYHQMITTFLRHQM